MELRVGLEFGAFNFVYDSLLVSSLEVCWVQGLGIWALGFEVRVSGLGLGCRIQELGFRCSCGQGLPSSIAEKS